MELWEIGKAVPEFVCGLTRVASAVLLFISTGAAQPAHWPQWRGPLGRGVASPQPVARGGLPLTWSKTENVVWVTELPGPGASTPAVFGDRVFVTSMDAANRETFAVCIDRRSGRILWQKRIGAAQKFGRGNTSATPSPVTDGRRVYFMYGTGDLLATDFKGKVLWRRNLKKEFVDWLIQFGYGGSPLLHAGKLYIAVMQADRPYGGQDGRAAKFGSYLLAVDAGTGRILWRRARPTDAREESKEAYTTPILLEVGRRVEILVLGGDCLTSHDPADGRELWRWVGYNPRRGKRARLIVSPVADPGGGLIYVTAPRGKEMFAVRPPGGRAGGSGTLGQGQVAWRYRGHLPDVCVPALDVDGHGVGRLYVLCGFTKVMTCFDAGTGEKKWEGKLGGPAVHYASPTVADGKIYCIDTEGNAVVLAAGDSFRVLSRIPMGEGPCHSTIVAAAGRLLIRTSRNLYCIGKQAR